MKINSFTADGVHDYLKFDINFFQDLTFLIGINGSGKTSALKLILGLTSPSFNYLNQINFQYCEVVCSTTENEKDIVIRAEQNKSDNTFKISLTLQGNTVTSDSIKRYSRNVELHYDLEELIMIEQRNKELFDNMEVPSKIRQLATPKFLGLDRRIYEGSFADNRFRTKRQYISSKYRRKGYDGLPEPPAIDASLEEVQSLIFDYIRKIAEQQPQISDDFKQKIFSQSFSFIEDNNIGEILPSDKIVERKQEVLKAIDSLGIKYLNWSVNTFFDKIEEVAKKNEQLSPKDKDMSQPNYSAGYIDILIKWNNNGSQLKRINDLISYSQDYQRKIAELRAPLKKLETIASNFLKEANKKLHIAADGEINVEIKNGKHANVYELSSGEKQIIIMIAHLIFEEAQKDSGVFIIDEPELSLHIAWQEIFIQSIMEASPKTQFILATHSPSIIAKVDREKYCQDLNKLN